MNENYYEILEVPETASIDEIKKSYLKILNMTLTFRKSLMCYKKLLRVTRSPSFPYHGNFYLAGVGHFGLDLLTDLKC